MSLLKKLMFFKSLKAEFRIKLTCFNDNSNRPSTKSWTDKGVETSDSVEGDQEMSGRMKSPKTINRFLSERSGRTVFIADKWFS